MACITFKKLITSWNHPAMSQLALRDIYQAILPDIYNEALAPASLYSEYQQSLVLMTPEILNKVSRGNKRVEKGGRYYVNATFTKMLQKALLSNQPIQYKEEVSDKESQTPKESMLSNIKSFVSITQPAFDHLPFTQETLYDTKLIDTIKKLLQSQNQDCLSYAVFLLILVSLFQDHITEFKEYYINVPIDSKAFNNEPYSEINNPYFTNLYKNDNPYIYFTDPMYMRTYNLYAYKTTNVPTLYQSGTLIMKLQENGIPHATLQLQKNINPSIPLKKREGDYNGTPMLSIMDEMVYIVLKNSNGFLMFLCFRYDCFHFAEIYFRTGFLVYSHSNLKIPYVQKIVISLKKLEETELFHIKGILKMSNDKIIITEQKLNNFLIAFAEAEWMDSFKKDFLPFIQTHKVQCYSFSETEILSYTLSELDELSRLQMLQALKTNSEAPDIISCKTPESMYRLFRD